MNIKEGLEKYPDFNFLKCNLYRINFQFTDIILGKANEKYIINAPKETYNLIISLLLSNFLEHKEYIKNTIYSSSNEDMNKININKMLTPRTLINIEQIEKIILQSAPYAYEELFVKKSDPFLNKNLNIKTYELYLYYLKDNSLTKKQLNNFLKEILGGSIINKEDKNKLLINLIEKSPKFFNKSLNCKIFISVLHSTYREYAALATDILEKNNQMLPAKEFKFFPNSPSSVYLIDINIEGMIAEFPSSFQAIAIRQKYLSTINAIVNNAQHYLKDLGIDKEIKKIVFSPLDSLTPKMQISTIGGTIPSSEAIEIIEDFCVSFFRYCINETEKKNTLKPMFRSTTYSHNLLLALKSEKFKSSKNYENICLPLAQKIRITKDLCKIKKPSLNLDATAPQILLKSKKPQKI